MVIKFKKILLGIFCAVFFGICALFSLGMLIPGASVAVEASEDMPEFISDGKINDDFGDQFENWFSKNFAFRGKVVDLFSEIRASLFKTGNDQVIVGKDGFLFFADTVDSYTGLDPMTADEIDGAAKSLLAMSDYAKDHQSKLLFMCAPNKSTVYPDMMPSRYVKCDGMTDLDMLYSKLDELDVDYIDLRETLAEASGSELIYHKRDTHWNGLGALYAFQAMAEREEIAYEDFGEKISVSNFEGDLDSLLYPDKVMYDDNITFNFDGRFIYTSAYTTPMDMQITTRGGGSGKCLMFRDSFANAMIPYIASSFSEVRFERANPYRIDMLDTYQADLVIVEIAERNLRDLIGADSRIGE